MAVELDTRIHTWSWVFSWTPKNLYKNIHRHHLCYFLACLRRVSSPSQGQTLNLYFLLAWKSRTIFNFHLYVLYSLKFEHPKLNFWIRPCLLKLPEIIGLDSKRACEMVISEPNRHIISNPIPTSFHDLSHLVYTRSYQILSWGPACGDKSS